MKKIYALSRKYLMSVLFLAFIGLFFGKSVSFLSIQMKAQIQNFRQSGTLSAPVSSLLTDSIPYKRDLINLNGGLYRLLGRRCINERYRLDDGQLTYVVPPMDVTEIAEKTLALHEVLHQEGIPFTYISLPFKVNPRDKGLPVGVEDYSNENADAFLKILEENGVDCLDIRQKIFDRGLRYTDLFLYTDHHWTPEAGLWAAGQIVEHLSAKNPAFRVDPQILNPESFTFTVYPKVFGGTAYARTGSLYISRDDLTIIEPKYDTQISFASAALGTEKAGSYRQALLNLNPVQYTSYCDGIDNLTNVRNASAAANLPVRSTPKKLLLIADSFSHVLVPFLSLSYDAVDVIDLRGYSGDLLEYVRSSSPDYVMTAYNAGVFEHHNSNMFDFIK